MKILDAPADSAGDPAQQGNAATHASPRVCVAHKFGGSSLADADCFRRVAAILSGQHESSQVVVVSAMGGVTDALLALGAAAVAGDRNWQVDLESLHQRHARLATELLGGLAEAEVAWLASEFSILRELLQALTVLSSPAPVVLERIQGLGEVFSARLLSTCLDPGGADTTWLDARDVLVVRAGELGVVVDWTQTRERLAHWRTSHPQSRVVVTGFIARDDDGRATILGRNGSDFSGAIFASLFDASELQVWTDVDGILSADPRLVPEAVSLASLSYHEAFELAYFGAKVIHPQTMTPALERSLPVVIRNTFNPAFAGTRITSTRVAAGAPVKALTLCSDLSMLNVEGAAMIGVPGTAQRVFDALRRAQVSVVMISQGSSEQSICCVVRATDAGRAADALRDAFGAELLRGQIQAITVTDDISVLAAVGDGMSGQPGTAARLFGALARAQINVRAIAQGASERNISVAIASCDGARALRAAHAGFWLSPQTISVGIIGASGHVGAALLGQLQQAIPRLRECARLDLRITALANSRTMRVEPLGIALDALALDNADPKGGLPCDLDELAAQVRGEHLPHWVIIDCSASDAVAEHYATWLASGIHVVTPNKHAGAGPLDRHERIREAARASGASFRYEATVGAGLPIVQTLRDLLDTGDALHRIEGVLSGTLAWLFNRYDGSRPFSQLVLDALALGYTEPDPRDDLSGTDVARKLVILAREAGVSISLSDVEVESLVPHSLASASRSEFLQRLHEGDAAMLAHFEQARRAGKVLRYVATLEADGRARVGLEALDAGHAFAHLRLTDNIVQFSTGRYQANPLVVQGPGAGPEVTAAGVFADLLRVAATVGTRF